MEILREFWWKFDEKFNEVWLEFDDKIFDWKFVFKIWWNLHKFSGKVLSKNYQISKTIKENFKF